MSNLSALSRVGKVLDMISPVVDFEDRATVWLSAGSHSY